MDIIVIGKLVGGLLTLIGLGLLCVQVRLGFQQDERSAGAEYNNRYLEISGRIPLSVMLDNKKMFEVVQISGMGREELLRVFYDYFLLCEEQLELGQQLKRRRFKFLYSKLVSLDEQVDLWRSAMLINMEKTAFREAFEEVVMRLGAGFPSEFSLMRQLVGQEIDGVLQ